MSAARQVHFECGCRDPVAAKDSYQEMFDWSTIGQFQVVDAGRVGHPLPTPDISR